MTPTEIEEMDKLDKLLEEAAHAPVDLPPGLAARVLQDASAMSPTARQRPKLSLVSRISSALGGWPALGGLAAATCAGFWIGFSPPAGMPDAGAFLLGEEEVTLDDSLAELSGFGWDMEEG